MVLGVTILKHFRVCFSSILLQGTPLVTSRLPGGGQKSTLNRLHSKRQKLVLAVLIAKGLNKKTGKNKKGRVTFPESIPIHFKRVLLCLATGIELLSKLTNFPK